MERIDAVGDVNPQDVLAGNRCCVCGGRAPGYAGGVPKALCWKCYQDWGAALIAREPWIYFLYRQEHSRRKRRATLLRRGIVPPKSLDALQAAYERGPLDY